MSEHSHFDSNYSTQASSYYQLINYSIQNNQEFQNEIGFLVKELIFQQRREYSERFLTKEERIAKVIHLVKETKQKLIYLAILAAGSIRQCLMQKYFSLYCRFDKEDVYKIHSQSKQLQIKLFGVRPAQTPIINIQPNFKKQILKSPGFKDFLENLEKLMWQMLQTYQQSTQFMGETYLLLLKDFAIVNISKYCQLELSLYEKLKPENLNIFNSPKMIEKTLKAISLSVERRIKATKSKISDYLRLQQQSLKPSQKSKLKNKR